MTTSDIVTRGRASLARREWAQAYELLTAADRDIPLAPEDLERLAVVAHLLGRDAESDALLARAHQDFLACGERECAARCAFWIGFRLIDKGEMAPGGGWIARAQRLVDEAGIDCVLAGYLLLPAGIRSVIQGDGAAAHTIFCQAIAIAERFHDLDLITMARHGSGRALIRLGRTSEGVALLDEAMVAVTANEISPMMSGGIYCSVIEACHEIFDLRRAQEWTAALNHWCAAQPDLVPYRGQCLIRRAEIMQLHGAWPDAMNEAALACEQLARPPGHPAIGAAFYQCGELHRLRGEFGKAEAAYHQASQRGRKPQPGFSLLHLAQGRVESAAAAIRHGLNETTQFPGRARMLAAAVEIMLAAGDAPAARAGTAELARMVETLDAPFLRALSSGALGSVLLAEGDADSALAAFRRAWAEWTGIDAPYEAARTRLLLGLAARRLGDEESAAMDLQAALVTFKQLGAAPDVARVEKLLHTAVPQRAAGLSDREIDVLRLLATGQTNRAIGETLFISDKTVARHVSNIFNKLGVSSRAAATAYAFQNGLAGSHRT